MYRLRSRKGVNKTKDSSVQTTIQFRKRKRGSVTAEVARHKFDEEDTRQVNTFSPPKRAMPVTRTSAHIKTAASSRGFPSPASQSTYLQSPLKSNNTPIKPVSPDPKTPSTTPITPKSSIRRLRFPESSVSEVKKSLHNSVPSSLLCREEQLTSLTSFLQSRLRDKRSGSLYISGAPGTGKTACLSQVLERSHDFVDPTHIVTVNCMSMKQPQAIYSRIASELLGSKIGKNKNITTLQSALVTHITSTKHMIVVVLDEVDQLDSRGQEVLYTLFEWPSLPRSRLLLIGIANALDLTDRVLPRLQSHFGCRPQLLHFPPYTREQLVVILQSRLGDGNLVDSMAIQFCARKVAAVHGDVRKALDICRRAIEKAETQAWSTADKENEATPTNKPLYITLRNMAEVISEVYNGSVVSVGGQTVPLQQKLVAVTLLCMVRGRARKETTLGKLYDSYIKVCRHRRLRGEGESEFMGLCEMLESRGVLSMRRARDCRDSKVTLKLEEDDLEHALQDKQLMTSVLEHGILV